MKRTLYIVIGTIVLLGGGYLTYAVTSGSLNSAYKVELFIPDATTDTCGYEYTIPLTPRRLSFCGTTNLNNALRQGAGVEVYNGVLDLTRMRFTKLPSEIGEYDCIQEIVLNRNCLSSFPMEVFRIGQLDEVDVSENSISRFPSLKENSSIEKLKLDYNNISSINGKDLAKFTKLRHLLLRGNSNLSALPKEIEKMHHIEILDVRSTKLAKDRNEIIRLMKAMPDTKIYYYTKKKKKKR